VGKLLMLATVFRRVANRVSQLSQLQTTLRQCDSCPYPFRDRAPTVALSRRGCWRGNRTGAKATRHAGLIFCKASTSHRSHSCICTETKKGKDLSVKSAIKRCAIGTTCAFRPCIFVQSGDGRGGLAQFACPGVAAAAKRTLSNKSRNCAAVARLKRRLATATT
jgi:hypothetical protein